MLDASLPKPRAGNRVLGSVVTRYVEKYMLSSTTAGLDSGVATHFLGSVAHPRPALSPASYRCAGSGQSGQAPPIPPHSIEVRGLSLGTWHLPSCVVHVVEPLTCVHPQKRKNVNIKLLSPCKILREFIRS